MKEATSGGERDINPYSVPGKVFGVEQFYVGFLELSSLARLPFFIPWNRKQTRVFLLWKRKEIGATYEMEISFTSFGCYLRHIIGTYIIR